jgi:hypothetical protein
MGAIPAEDLQWQNGIIEREDPDEVQFEHLSDPYDEGIMSLFTPYASTIILLG